MNEPQASQVLLAAVVRRLGGKVNLTREEIAAAKTRVGELQAGEWLRDDIRPDLGTPGLCLSMGLPKPDGSMVIQSVQCGDESCGGLLHLWRTPQGDQFVTHKDKILNLGDQEVVHSLLQMGMTKLMPPLDMMPTPEGPDLQTIMDKVRAELEAQGFGVDSIEVIPVNPPTHRKKP